MAESVRPKDPEVFAGEYALGLLEGEERADASRRALSDPSFAGAVDWWQLHFAGLYELIASVPAPTDLWQAIERRLDRVEFDRGEPTMLAQRSRGPSGWSLTALAASLALAVASLVLYNQSRTAPDDEPQIAQAPNMQPQLVAALAATPDATRPDQTITARIDRATDTLRLRIDAMEAGEEFAANAPELWVVPAGGQPRSLGLIPAGGGFERRLTAAERAMLIGGSTLAITFESKTGAPHAAPTTPIVAAGQLVEI